MHTEKANLRSSLSLFLMVFPPVALLVAGLGYWYEYEEKSVVLERYRIEAKHHVEGQMNRVQRFYKQGVGMLLALAHNRSFNTAIAGNANARREVAEIFRDVMNASGMYDQIRLLDSTGREAVRVEHRGDRKIEHIGDHTGDHVRVVPAGQLQYKGARYYVRRALALSGGAVYVSPFDLNMEHGRVQRPYKSMIRFATPVVDDNGKKSGVVIINMPGNSLMQRELSETVLEGEHLLINAGSPYWFDRHVNQLHVLENMNNVVQSHGFSGGWLRALKEDNGQHATVEGQFTVESTVPALPGMMSKTLILPQWKIVSFVPAAALNAATGRSVSQIRTVCAIVIAFLAVIIWLWSQRHSIKSMVGQTIRDSEARLRMAEKDMDMGYWDWDMLSDTVTWSDGFNRVFGLNGTHVTPSFDTVVSCMHPDDRESLKAEIVEAIHSNNRHEAEFRITRDGKERYIHASGQMLFTEGARPARMFGTIHDITELMQAEQQREALLNTNRRLAQGLIKAREEERTMLARALHDDIGQKLTAIQMQAAAVAGQCSEKNCPTAKRGMRMIQDISIKLIETVRSQLKQLRPPELDELGLKAAFSSLCRRWQENSGVDCHIRVCDAVDALGDDMKLNLYRIVQEALTNVARHAKASEVHVNLRMNEVLHLTIRDDGCGFDPDALTDGIGLTGMRERMDLLGGSMRIESAPGKGTELIFQILHRNKDKEKTD